MRHEYINGIYCKKDGRLQPAKTWLDAHLVVLTGRETFCYQPYEDKWYQLAEIPFDGDIATRGNANNKQTNKQNKTTTTTTKNNLKNILVEQKAFFDSVRIKSADLKEKICSISTAFRFPLKISLPYSEWAFFGLLFFFFFFFLNEDFSTFFFYKILLTIQS